MGSIMLHFSQTKLVIVSDKTKMAPIRLRSAEQIEDELTVAFIEIRKLVQVGGMD